ncbi:Probable cytochrome P450 301a1, mitochondrial [Eumeta japonica]|uniref:Cholesterol side-chain cleavage enzyme, mitochondrial n=1 Tax=Eumeta variegata TaxID=151549 RepID=A0A4C1UBJ6_EUMVA|nr:Probable cytochrome P450 301a1, mitochondrial [Eumeta japonica]
MSTKDSALKEGNYDDATKFYPDRWLKPDSKEYHAFASIPFGFGARKCIGQNVAEVMLAVLTIKLIGKYKMEYHYGDIVPTRGFIAKPNKPLKIRFIDRYKDI